MRIFEYMRMYFYLFCRALSTKRRIRLYIDMICDERTNLESFTCLVITQYSASNSINKLFTMKEN